MRNLIRSLTWMLITWMLGATGVALAHDVPPSIVSLDIGHRSIDVELQLQLSELGAALGLPLATNRERVLADYGPRIEQYVREHLQLRGDDGQPFSLVFRSPGWRQTDNPAWNSNDWLLMQAHFQAPPGVSTQKFELVYSVIIDHVVSHDALVYVRRDFRHGLIGDRPELVGMMSFGKAHLTIDGAGGSWLRGFDHLFALGLQHIAEGTDHLLFLLTLLLPAPLLCRRGRWTVRRSGADSLRSIVRVVSGFTIGHSLTLGLVAEGWLSPNTRLVEVLIAVSILVSSLHAWRPLFANGEGWLACGFGLVHGMAFAEVLSGLNFDGYTLILSLLAFNLGIEAMQLLVVLVVLPVLLLSSQGRGYRVVRQAIATFSGVCAASWILERAGGIRNPLAPLLRSLSPLPLPLVIVTCVVSAGCVVVLLVQRRQRQCAATLGPPALVGRTNSNSGSIARNTSAQTLNASR